MIRKAHGLHADMMLSQMKFSLVALRELKVDRGIRRLPMW